MKTLFYSLFIFLPFVLKAQANTENYSTFHPRIIVEAGGIGFLGSISGEFGFENRKTSSVNLRIGIGFLEPGAPIFPLNVNFQLGRRNFKGEIGFGVAFLRGEIYTGSQGRGPSWEKVTDALLHLEAGVRWYSNHHFFAGLNALGYLETREFFGWPWAGLMVGWQFGKWAAE